MYIGQGAGTEGGFHKKIELSINWPIPFLVTVYELVRIEENEGEVGKCPYLWANVGGLCVTFVVVEAWKNFLIIKSLPREFLNKRASDFGRVFAGFRGVFCVIGTHLPDIEIKLSFFLFAGVSIEDELESPLDLFGERLHFLF